MIPRIIISPSENIIQLIEPKSGCITSIGEEAIIPSRDFIKLNRKENITIVLPVINNFQSLLFNVSELRYSSQCNNTTDSTIIENDKMIGAITGPTHGAGIKNNISAVIKDSGQSRNIFRKI